MYYLYATCSDYVSYENPRGGGGCFSSCFVKYFTQNILKNNIISLKKTKRFKYQFEQILTHQFGLSENCSQHSEY